MLNIQENFSLAPITSFRIGGNASYFVDVRSVAELKEALLFAKEKNIDFYVLAGGTNILISDKGFDGIIIRMKMNEIKSNKTMITADAGVPLIKVVNIAANECLTGIESLAGVPGTFGGAVRGNAGAFGTEVGSRISYVTALDANTLEFKKFPKEICDFSYRSSHFKKHKNLIIVSATLELDLSEKESCQQKVKDVVMGRTHKGLQGVKSAGSFFMNPKVENSALLEEFKNDKGVAARNNVLPAGWVIERAGLRGKKIGGAAISEEHANYIVNTGDAKAEDVIMLVSYIKQQVRDQLGIQLQEEVNYLGF